MIASMVSALDRVRHFLRTVVTSQATSCSARLLWLEISMMMTSRPFRTDSMQLHTGAVISKLEPERLTEKPEPAEVGYPLVLSMSSMAEGTAARRPLEPSGVAEPMLAKISNIICVPDSERGGLLPTLRRSCLLAPVMTFSV